MYGINNQPWKGLDKFVDIDSLRSMRPYFARALALSNQYKVVGTVGSQRHLNDQSKVDLTETVLKLTNNEDYQYKDLLKGLNYDKTMMFFKYMHDCATLGEVVPLRRLYGEYYDKHRSVSSRNGPAYDNFDFFHKWLQDQNIFEEIGRILIFVNEPGVASTMHSDYGDHQSRRDPFIWLSIDSRKKFWIYDQDTDTKHYVTDSVVTFDNADWHGSDQCDFVGWSLRVDGIFKKEFLEKSGLSTWIDYNSQFESMTPKTT